MNYIIIRSLCLVVALFTMQSYFFYGAHTKSHRFLPVLLTCVCLYGFYELVLALTNADDLFLLLEQLLLVQVIYITIHYIFDFSNETIPLRAEALGLTSLLVGDVFTFLQHFFDKAVFHVLYLVFVYGFLAVVIISTLVFTLTKRIKSKRERYIVGMLYLAFLFPSFGLPFRRYSAFGAPIFCVCLIVSCCIVLYLLRNGFMSDMKQELQENIYNNNHICTILFDSKKQFLDANHMAKQCFSEIYLQNCFSLEKDNDIFEYRNSIYRYFTQPVTLSDGFEGYIVTALDITDEQQQLNQYKKELAAKDPTSELKDYGIFVPDEKKNSVTDTYCNEVSSIASTLDSLAHTDLALFRIKVHGIKSSSKQLGYTNIGEQAEIMEMAAKLENKDFIFSHLDSFVQLCNDTVSTIKEGR